MWVNKKTRVAGFNGVSDCVQLRAEVLTFTAREGPPLQMTREEAANMTPAEYGALWQVRNISLQRFSLGHPTGGPPSTVRCTRCEHLADILDTQNIVNAASLTIRLEVSSNSLGQRDAQRAQHAVVGVRSWRC